MDIINLGNGDIKESCLISFFSPPEQFICPLNSSWAGYALLLGRLDKTAFTSQRIRSLDGVGEASFTHPKGIKFNKYLDT